jgi:hypothetical protein
MNPQILVPFTITSSDVAPLAPLGRLDQPPRLVQRQLDVSKSVDMYHEKPIMGSSEERCCAPRSPTSVMQVICEEPAQLWLCRLAGRNKAATVIQSNIRGTLARWNLRVLKLQHKLASIQAIKEKQLRKLRQRTEQAKRSVRAEHEYLEEHRIVRRRLRRAKCIRNRYAQLKVAESEQNHQLKAECVQLTQHNDECAKILETFIQHLEVAQCNLSVLQASHRELQATCETYRWILQVLQEVTGAETQS